MRSPLISVIVPVHNSEMYVDLLLQSLLKQTYQDYELIIINDHSSDSSMSIIQHYSEHFNHIKIKNADGKGSANARNEGFNISTGQYISFLDSDDYIEYDFLEKMLNSIKFNNSQIAICGYDRIDERTDKVLSKEMCSQNECIMSTDDKASFINTSLWNKLFDRNILFGEKIPDIFVCEDAIYLYNIMLKDVKISFVNECLYHYLVRPNSVMGMVAEKDIDRIMAQFYYFGIEAKKHRTNVILKTFLHLGLSLPLAIEKRGGNVGLTCYKAKMVLKNVNLKWYKNKQLTFNYLKEYKVKGIAIWLSKFALRMGMLPVLAVIINSASSVFKRQFKW